MARFKEANEPSMEEILASIRRIISDEAAPLAKIAPAAETVSTDASEEDLDRLFAQNDDVKGEVLVLTDEVEDEEESGGPTIVEAQADIVFEDAEVAVHDRTEPAPAPEPAPPPAANDTSRPSGHRLDPLLSRASDESISAAFGSLSEVVLSSRSRTLEDLLSDMLRPMLREWLDKNLPTLVEHMVRQEIERVSRGR